MHMMFPERDLESYQYYGRHRSCCNRSTGQHRRYIQIARSLGEEFCWVIPFCFVLTGYDTISQFARRGKQTAWQV